MNDTRTTKATAVGRVLRLVALFLVASVSVGRAAEAVPPEPRNHFNDYAGLVDASVARQLNDELAQFERETSNQIVVAVFSRLPAGASAEDYAVRVAQAWGAGRQREDNGAVLFVFRDNREVRIVTGYGLEGALPDALCKRIIEEEIVPRFRDGDLAGGLIAGVRAMIAAARGEYRGTGRLAAQSGGAGDTSDGGTGIIFFVVLLVVLSFLSRRARHGGRIYGNRGRRTVWFGPGPWIGGGRGGLGGGGTFLGGGGSFGGGGAGGRW